MKHLIEKLTPLTDYISEPDEKGNFFVTVDDTRINGDQAHKFICIAETFGYYVEFAVVNKFVIFFNKL